MITDFKPFLFPNICYNAGGHLLAQTFRSTHGAPLPFSAHLKSTLSVIALDVIGQDTQFTHSELRVKSKKKEESQGNAKE